MSQLPFPSPNGLIIQFTASQSIGQFLGLFRGISYKKRWCVIKFGKTVKYANLAGLLRALIMLMWTVSLEAVRSSSEEHFPNLFAPQAVSSGVSLGTDMPHRFWNYCCSCGESLQAFKQNQRI